MIKSDKKLKNLAALLEKDDAVLISQAIEMLRDEEPFEGAVSLLASYYDKTSSPAVLKAIESFMNDMKDKSVQQEIISEILKERNPATTAMLAASCWQSGMDYSGFTRDFTEVFLHSDLGTAVECFTVIEGSIPELDEGEKEEIIEIIREHPEDRSVTKKSLRKDLLALLGA